MSQLNKKLFQFSTLMLQLSMFYFSIFQLQCWAINSDADSVPEPSTAAEKYVDKLNDQPVSIRFNEVELRIAFQELAEYGGYSLIVSDSVQGKISLQMNQVPWQEIFQLVIRSKGLSFQKKGSVIWVATSAEIQAADKQHGDLVLSKQNLASLETHLFQLNYTHVADMAAHLLGHAVADPNAANIRETTNLTAANPRYGSFRPGTPAGTEAAVVAAVQRASVSNTSVPGSRILSARGVLLADARTNQLFVTDLPERIAQVQRMIKILDIPLQQVQIEAKIVEADENFGKTLGAQLSALPVSGGRAAVSPNLDASSAVLGSAVAAPANALSLAAPSIDGALPATVALSLFNASKTNFISVELSGLEGRGQGKIISSPSIVTADKVKAVIEQGTELPYQVGTSNTNSHTIAFRKAVLRLEVTPQITPGGEIVLDLDITKDAVGQLTAAGFAIDTKHIHTQVRVENGGTLVIGGIFESTQNESQYKVPYLADLPLIGRFFGQSQNKQSKQELMIFITPKMLVSSVS